MLELVIPFDMKGSFLILVSLCLVVTVYTDTCPAGWNNFGQSCYKFSSDRQQWDVAKTKCSELGGYLTEIESQEETNFLQPIATQAGKSEGYWIGGKKDENGRWNWKHSGRSIQFTNWNSGEPNNAHGNEKCLQLFYSPPSNWNDLTCSESQYYICERSDTPTCTCTGSGDPHYKTYDGQWIHFQGACKYTLTSYKDEKCEFSVEAKHEYRGSSRAVTYLRLVDIKYGGHVFRLHKGLTFYVDDVQKYLPYNSAGVKVFMSGTRLRLEITSCGVSVDFDGNHALSVTVPKTMGEQLKGICGNCNGKADDFTTKEGQDVSNDNNKYTLVGNSYEVPDDSDLLLPQCRPWTDVHMCTKELIPKAEQSFCSLLNPKKKDQSVFKACIEADSARALEAYDSCLYDFCATSNASIICGDLADYAHQCSSLGIRIQWRTQTRCPLPCKENAVYNPSMSACHRTCVDPKADETCKLPVVEGCQCKEGYILSDSDCVPVSNCGCKHNGEYIPIGTEIESPDCTSIKKCQIGGSGKAELITENRTPCGTNAICKAVKGHYKCICRQGTEGNPLEKCQDPFCTCTASGDPHYKTFDGQMIHFQGACKYTVAAMDQRKCKFAVEGKHQYWGSSKRVTTMRLVDFKYDFNVYRLHQDKKFYVNGARKYAPFSDKNVKVVLTGNKLRLEGPCNVTVEFDGVHYMKLKVPRDIGASVKGICGNCNSKADDLKTKEGKDVSSEKNKFTLIGNSYEVKDDSDLFLPQCRPTTDIQSCTAEQRKRAESSLCRHLNPANKLTSIFKKCIEIDEMRAQESYDSCIIDFCELEQEKPDIVCQTLQEYADQCQAIGEPVHWRDTNICPLPCKKNAHYKHLMTACPATCTDINASTNCKIDATEEGCECDQGYVRSDLECVLIAECGCKTDSGDYTPVGKKIESPCTSVSECVLPSGATKPNIVTTKVTPCGENAECKNVDDQFKCECVNGTTGNPHEKCAVPVCGKKADIAFLLDSSSSLGWVNFNKVLSFVKNMVNSFDIGKDKVRIGVMSYSSSRRNQIWFNLNQYFTKESINRKIGYINYFTGSTYTDKALLKMASTMFTEANGDRTGVPNLGIVITDGKSTWADRTKIAADNVHQKGIKMFAIGITNQVNQDELEYIASKKEYVEMISDFDKLQEIFAKFQILTCKGIDE